MNNSAKEQSVRNGFGEVFYETHDASRKYKAVYKMFEEFCVYIDVENGSPINFGADIARLIAKQETRRWPGDLKIFCLEPMNKWEDHYPKRRHQFEFVEIVYDPDDVNYHCDYVHTGCPMFIREAFKEFLTDKPQQTFEHITPGKGWVVQDWSDV